MKEQETVISNRLNIPVEEAYIMLRTNIQFCGFDKNIKTIAVTSTNPGEGKTTTAINMSIALARVGMKVLLVDGDMRTSGLGKSLDTSNVAGLSNILIGRSVLKDVAEKTNVDNLYIIKSGVKPPNPAELLSSVNFNLFLKDASENYDIVIIDTPPLGSVIDAAVIASHTDGTVLVVKARGTNYRSVQRVKEQLEKANAKLLGVVLNRMKKRDYATYFEHYNYYHERKRKAAVKKISIPAVQEKSQKTAI